MTTPSDENHDQMLLLALWDPDGVKGIKYRDSFGIEGSAHGKAQEAQIHGREGSRNSGASTTRSEPAQGLP
jgi:hypothetical protein